LWEQQRLELVEGELLSKMGKDRPHVHALSVLLEWLFHVFGGQYVNLEAPIDVAPEDNPTSEPELDIIVLARPSSALYARAGILEYWVRDIAACRMVVHRDPQNGLYSSVTVYNAQEAVAPLTMPGREFHIARAFGPV
jgi:hypothetical protein